jgi:CrcB protein
MTLLYIGAGGALGAMARYLMVGLVQRGMGGSFPWGTLAVNILGAFAMGLIVETAARFWSPSPEIRAFLTTGVLGGFTTFSAFSLETGLMIEKGDWVSAAAYIAASVTLCVLALFLGLWLIRAITP